MRKIIVVIVLLLAAAFLSFGIAELQEIRDTLREGNIYFLLAAFLAEIICMCNTSATFGALYRLVGLKEGRGQLFLMTSAANFVNLIAPSAGVGGIAVLLDAAKRRKISTARVVVVGMLYILYEYAALFCILLLGFIVLIRQNDLNVGELIAAGFLVVVALSIGVLLVLGYRFPDQLGNLLARLAELANRIIIRFLHRDYLSVENAYKFSQDVADGISAIRGNRKGLIWPFLFTLNNKVLLLCILALIFLALNTPFTIGTLVGAFSVSYLFFYASPTPSGVGIVEGIMPAALNTLLIPLTNAVLITLAFRGVTLWFPFAIGAISFRLIQKQPKALDCKS